jgi:hypothetical protein
MRKVIQLRKQLRSFLARLRHSQLSSRDGLQHEAVVGLQRGGARNHGVAAVVLLQRSAVRRRRVSPAMEGQYAAYVLCDERNINLPASGKGATHAQDRSRRWEAAVACLKEGIIDHRNAGL